MKIPIGGLPGKRSRRDMSENVNAALQINADKVGGRLPAETINAIVVTEVKAVNIKIKIMRVSNFVESLLSAVKSDEERPCENSSNASSKDF